MYNGTHFSLNLPSLLPWIILIFSCLQTSNTLSYIQFTLSYITKKKLNNEIKFTSWYTEGGA